MLTVKLVEPNGFEQIFEAETVWKDPDTLPDLIHSIKDNQVLNFGGPPSSKGPTFLYVMNEHGKTVAKYEW